MCRADSGCNKPAVVAMVRRDSKRRPRHSAFESTRECEGEGGLLWLELLQESGAFA